MKRTILKNGIISFGIILIGFSLSAQHHEKGETKMKVLVLKEGKAVLDTTYIMDNDFDKGKIEAMVEELDGDSKMISIFKSDDNDGEDYNFEIRSHDSSKGKLRWLEKGGNEIIISEDIHIEKGEDGKSVKYLVKKIEGGDKKSQPEIMLIKKKGAYIGSGELETEVIVSGEEIVPDFDSNEANVMFFSDDKDFDLKKEKGNVFIHSEKGDNKNVMFLKKEKKNHIGLDLKEDGKYRLEFESDEMLPVKIEVFDGEGNRLFKKKVRNFYGRFLKDIELSGNETGLYTVRVLQGEKEIIGEFEYR